MKLKRVVLDTAIKFNEGKQAQWEQVIPSARYESPKYEMYYDEQNQIVGITLGDETKLIHASRVSFIIPENAGHWLDRWRPIPWTDAQPTTDAGTVTVTDVKIDKRTKAYRDSVKQNGGT